MDNKIRFESNSAATIQKPLIVTVQGQSVKVPVKPGEQRTIQVSGVEVTLSFPGQPVTPEDTNGPWKYRIEIQTPTGSVKERVVRAMNPESAAKIAVEAIPGKVMSYLQI